MKASNDAATSRSAEASAARTESSKTAADTSSAGARRSELSATDKAVQERVQTKAGAAALVDSSKVKLDQQASMTPSEFWGSKLGECYSKGISVANCTPWS